MNVLHLFLFFLALASTFCCFLPSECVEETITVLSYFVLFGIFDIFRCLCEKYSFLQKIFGKDFHQVRSNLWHMNMVYQLCEIYSTKLLVALCVCAQRFSHRRLDMASLTCFPCWKINGKIKRLQVVYHFGMFISHEIWLHSHLNRVIYLNIISDCFCYMFCGVNSDFSH